MNKDFAFNRSIWGYLIGLPMAVMLGYLLARPTSLKTIGVVGLVLGVLSFPLLLRWHQLMLIASWNASMVVFFLPGDPSLMIPVAAVSLGFAMLNRCMKRSDNFLHVRLVAWPLFALVIVVVLTALATGGIGGRAIGSEMWGGKRYLQVLGAIMGYFALVSMPIPRNRANLYAGLYFLSGTTAIMSDVAYAAGPAFYFLFNFFPAEVAFHQATTAETIHRLTGVAFATQAAYSYMLLRYGIRGLMDFRRPWRLLLFCALVWLGLMGGFRSSVILFCIVFSVQFMIEGLYKTRYLPILGLAAVLVGTLVVVNIHHLPFSVQRSLSFLPLDVHPMARQDAMSTVEWRVEMWKALLPEVPQYLWQGKGYLFSGTDYELTQMAVRRGMITGSFEDTMVAGNYHHGILTLIIPFGVWGLAAFLAFAAGGVYVLWRNNRHGDADLKHINTFLLALFLARLFFYLTIYGQFDLDLAVFTGAIGLSIALNGGVCRPAPARAPAPATEPVQLPDPVPAT